jgi:hypothetical protein
MYLKDRFLKESFTLYRVATGGGVTSCSNISTVGAPASTTDGETSAALGVATETAISLKNSAGGCLRIHPCHGLSNRLLGGRGKRLSRRLPSIYCRWGRPTRLLGSQSCLVQRPELHNTHSRPPNHSLSSSTGIS